MNGALRRWRRLSLTGLVLAAGCGLFDPTVVEVSVTVNPSSVAPGSSLQIEIRSTNRGSEPVQISVQGCPREFEVLDEDDTVVGPGTVLCALALRAPLTLEPGQSNTAVYQWSGERADTEWTRLPEGEYRIRGWVDVIAEARVYGDTKQVRVLGASSP